MPNYFAPNFLRPLPVEEEENEDGESGLMGEGANLLSDEFDALWLVPGIIPEPYWDYSMCQNFNTATIKHLLNKAVKSKLLDDEHKTLLRALKTDPELVFHIGMSP